MRAAVARQTESAGVPEVRLPSVKRKTLNAKLGAGSVPCHKVDATSGTPQAFGASKAWPKLVCSKMSMHAPRQHWIIGV
jgi:hypothetical protein